MLKKLIWWVLGLGLVVALAAPPLIGLAAERYWPRVADQLAEALPGYIVVSEPLERGWFRSRAFLRVVESDPVSNRLIHDESSTSLFGDQPAWSGEVILGHGLWPVVRSGKHRWLPALLGGELLPEVDGGDSLVRWPQEILFEVSLAGTVSMRGTLNSADIKRLIALTDDERFSATGGQFHANLNDGIIDGELVLDNAALADTAQSAERISIRKRAQLVDGQWNATLNWQIDGLNLPGADLIHSRGELAIAKVPADFIAVLPADPKAREIYLARWLSDGGRVDLKSLEIDSADQQLVASGWASGKSAIGDDDLLALANAVFNLSIPVAMAREWVRLANSPNAAAALAGLQRNEDQYELALQLEDGVLTLNGTTYDLLALRSSSAP